MKKLLYLLSFLLSISCNEKSHVSENLQLKDSNLKFGNLATTWDEAIPLGNGILGALVWQKDNKLRLSLDRADLWDLRPMENLNNPEWKYSWVKKQWDNNTYSKVQELFDVPYDRNPAPSKIPGAALEFDISSLGEIQYAELSLAEATCYVKWKGGATLETFVNANSKDGWFKIKGANTELVPELISPPYNLEGKAEEESPVTGQDLRRLGYPKGEIIKSDNSITYNHRMGRFQISGKCKMESSKTCY
jgi:alpha-L-fucosidase 2